MTQIQVWEQLAENLDGEDLVFYWADKMATICEYLTLDTRVGSISTLFPLMEEVCDRYNSSRERIKEIK